MSDSAVLPLAGNLVRAARLTLVSVLMSLVLGGAALWLGSTKNAIGQWGFGAACLLLVPAALSVQGRIREGLGNRGLERERLTLRVTSHLLRLLALGMAAASALELSSHPVSDSTFESVGFSALASGLLLALWLAKRGLAEVHPTLDLDGSRTRALLELALLLLAGNLLGRWFFWASAVTGLALALRLFSEGQTLAKGSTLPPACGGCGSGCGCG